MDEKTLVERFGRGLCSACDMGGGAAFGPIDTSGEVT
jgi:hypothetical protein